MKTMYTLLAALVFAACAPLSSTGPAPFSTVREEDSGSVYTVEVTNHDYDAHEVRVYCGETSHALMIIRDVALGERRVQRARGRYCDTLRFASYGITSRMLFASPPISVNVGGILKVTLTEHPRQTNWSVWVGQRASGS